MTKKINSKHAAIRAARVAATEAMLRDKSDPFVYGRVYTHMLNGIGEEHGKPSGEK